VIIQKDDEYPLLYFLALINSKLFTYFIDEQSAKSSNKSYPSFNSRLLKELPIIECPKSIKEVLIELAKSMLNQTENFKKRVDEIVAFLSSKFNISDSRKLQNWHELDFAEFLKELEKARKKGAKDTSREHAPLANAPLAYQKLTLSEEAEWMQYFNEQKQKAVELKAEIDKTDQDIDQMVYELYGLNQEEIAIVEDFTK
jgi:hypothetical protein